MPKRLPAPLPALWALLGLLLAGAASAKSPEEFLEDKNGPKAEPASPAKPAPAAPAPAKPAAKAAKDPGPMDTAKVHEKYLEGEFDAAIRSLEAQLKSKRPMTHQESVFVFKHLGVMYAASPATRDKGKLYMHELINIEPTAKILDMYASDMIHLIFRNVQEEFQSKQTPAPAPEPTAVAAAPPPEQPPPPAEPAKRSASGSGNRKTLYLAAAGAGVAVGALTLFLLLGEDEPQTKTIVIDQ